MSLILYIQCNTLLAFIDHPHHVNRNPSFMTLSLLIGLLLMGPEVPWLFGAT
jgi:hypothetical protein